MVDLCLTCCNLKVIDPLIYKMRNLKYLDLTGNDFECVSKKIQNLTLLEELDLWDCLKLKLITSEIGHLPNVNFNISTTCPLNKLLCFGYDSKLQYTSGAKRARIRMVFGR